jgi:hypothetical protein
VAAVWAVMPSAQIMPKISPLKDSKSAMKTALSAHENHHHYALIRDFETGFKE